MNKTRSIWIVVSVALLVAALLIWAFRYNKLPKHDVVAKWEGQTIGVKIPDGWRLSYQQDPGSFEEVVPLLELKKMEQSDRASDPKRHVPTIHVWLGSGIGEKYKKTLREAPEKYTEVMKGSSLSRDGKAEVIAQTHRAVISAALSFFETKRGADAKPGEWEGEGALLWLALSVNLARGEPSLATVTIRDDFMERGPERDLRFMLRDFNLSREMGKDLFATSSLDKTILFSEPGWNDREGLEKDRQDAQRWPRKEISIALSGVAESRDMLEVKSAIRSILRSVME